jgi:hypothetical protein
MEIFNYGCLVTAAFGQTRHNIIISQRALVVCYGNVVPSSHILVTLMMEALLSSETLILTGSTRRNIREDGVLLKYLLY